MIEELNERMVLPHDITIAFQKCGRANAFYDEDTHRITLCYELVDDYFYLFSSQIRNKAKLDVAVRGAIAFIFFHEMGHALIDAWNLPITGKVEDAADQLSTLILLEEIERGDQLALNSALSFELYAYLAKGQKKIYWDEHSLDEQRFYDILCMLYGHDPEKYAYLTKDGLLPLPRAELCKGEYPRFKMSWQTLLAPYMKSPLSADSKISMH